MKALNWFQARDLAKVQKRAIRRDGWRKWLLYRLGIFTFSETDPETGLERRWHPLCTEFRDSELLAKDWTDEVWEGGTKPPCTEPKDATELAPNSSGGAGTFTLTAHCGGAGAGGGVFGQGGPGITEDPPSAIMIVGIANDISAGSSLDPLEPDGGACWITPPANFRLVVAGTMGSNEVEIAFFQYAADGADLSGDLPIGDQHPDADYLASDPGGYSFGAMDFGENYNAVQFPFIPYVPGATISLRVDMRLSNGEILTGLGELVLPPDCP